MYFPNQLGGAEKSVQLIAEGLLEAGVQPVVVCTGDVDRVNFVNGVKVYYVNTENLYWVYEANQAKSYLKPIWHLIDSYNFMVEQKINEIINLEDPDAVHTNNLAGFSDIIWLVAKKRNLKIIHTIRDYYQLCPKSTMYKNGKTCSKQCLSCRLYSFPRKKLSSLVDHVIGISSFVLQKHIELGYFKNATKHVIYNSITLPFKQTIKKPDSNKLVLGFVGTLAPSKGIEFLLSEFCKLKDYELELKVFGKPKDIAYGEHLKHLYKNDRVQFLGFQKPEDLYRQIELLIVPSLWDEPFGRIVPEANSYGIPVLVSNKGGLPELIQEGKNGFIFDPDKDNDFQSKLVMAINLNRRAGFRFDLSEFSQKIIISKYLKVLS